MIKDGPSAFGRGDKPDDASFLDDRQMGVCLLYTSEADIVANTYSDIETFVQEGIMRFILGTDSMDNWDSFTEQIRSLGIDEVIAAKQAAYDRFQSR